MTWRRRPPPDFVIIGAQRAGTTSLFRDLRRHPQVIPPLTKEIHYFDYHHDRGEAWYRAHFPTRARRADLRRDAGIAITGEATPNYLFHPHAPLWARHELASCRMIVLLRDPVDRAYSHWKLMTRLGHETLPFLEAIERENERTEMDRLALESDPHHAAYAWFRYSYVARGRYASQLATWFHHLGRDRFLVLRTEDRQRDMPATFRQVTDFLAIAPWRPPVFSHANRADGDPMPPDVRRELEARFAADNQRLADLLGRDMAWNKRRHAPANGMSVPH